ncbi:MAG: hypothetical protein WC655_24475 [Candidatus Hydrogenedentales bacterium]|jgi:hypothetical protein
MKELLALVFGIFAVIAAWPAIVIWRIVWQDRKVPTTHPDYSALYYGKRTVLVAAAVCTVAVLLCAAVSHWLLS